MSWDPSYCDTMLAATAQPAATTSNTATPLTVEHVIQKLSAALARPGRRLPYTVLLHLLFDDVGSDRRAQLDRIVDRAIEENLADHPYLHAAASDIWTPARPASSDSGTANDRCLTAAGAAIAAEAWCQDSHLNVSRYSADEHTRLRFWRCHGAHILGHVFVGAPENELPLHLRAHGTHASQHLLPLRMSHLHWRESLRHHERAPHANRPRYERFTRLQAYGLNIDPVTGQPSAFFLPASQILTHMSNYFRTSSLFEMPKQSRSAAAYVKHAKFTNLMLLNVCGEVMRQIVQLFRMHEADDRNAEKFLIQADEVLLLQHSPHLQTLTEQITRDSEPDTWLTDMNVTLQRVVGTFAPHAAVTAFGSNRPVRRRRVTPDGVSLDSPMQSPADAAWPVVSQSPHTGHLESGGPGGRHRLPVVALQNSASSVRPPMASSTTSSSSSLTMASATAGGVSASEADCVTTGSSLVSTSTASS